MISRKPILVTGSHRSGSTWVGRMLAISPSVGYIQEPFNISNRFLNICSPKFDYWFFYISSENEKYYYERLKKNLSFSFNIIDSLKTVRSRNDIRQLLKVYRDFLKYKIHKVRPLVKDPIAVFSAEWLSATFDMDVVVLIRHPAAFVSSIKINNWTFPFIHLLEQPLLMKDYLYPFKTEIKKYVEKEHDLIDQAILLWRIIYYVVIKYQHKHKDWIFIRHEDLSRDPSRVFENLYKKLNLEFTEHIKEVIREHSSSKNPGKPVNGLNYLKRDSIANIWNWKNRLTKQEIRKIRIEVEEISSSFYLDEDW